MEKTMQRIVDINKRLKTTKNPQAILSLLRTKQYLSKGFRNSDNVCIICYGTKISGGGAAGEKWPICTIGHGGGA